MTPALGQRILLSLQLSPKWRRTLAIECRVDLIIAMMIPGMNARRMRIGNRDEKITM
jgi:hypothetical protein